MAIDSYLGVPGLSILVETEQDLYDALDAIQSQVMDMDENHPTLFFLSRWMDQLLEMYPEIEV
jgi:hypothetical protein